MHISIISTHWEDIINNKIKLTKQNEAAASEWPGRKPEDGEINCSMTMDEADKLVRAVTHPYPGAFFKSNSTVMRIWSAKTDSAEGQIKLADGYLTPIEYDIEKGDEQ
jgi:methionyl-tRNA formyltransferase